MFLHILSVAYSLISEQGTNSGVIAGINYVSNDSKTRTGCTAGVVGSMSLGGSKSTAVNSAVANAVSAGVFMAVAAGNEAQLASNVSPASEATAFTVGASDSTDKFASFSNYGSAVDMVAPGVSILSTWLNGGTVSQPVLHPHSPRCDSCGIGSTAKTY
jgi:hypothetical protein